VPTQHGHPSINSGSPIFTHRQQLLRKAGRNLQCQALLAALSDRCSTFERAYTQEVLRNDQLRQDHAALASQHLSLRKQMDMLQTEVFAQEAVAQRCMEDEAGSAVSSDHTAYVGAKCDLGRGTTQPLGLANANSIHPHILAIPSSTVHHPEWIAMTPGQARGDEPTRRKSW
jgi:hypothetical protein